MKYVSRKKVILCSLLLVGALLLVVIAPLFPRIAHEIMLYIGVGLLIAAIFLQLLFFKCPHCGSRSTAWMINMYVRENIRCKKCGKMIGQQ
ncbi:transposase [Eubacteriales bacterium OttesenSCG-928-K08]|nr:transposase [Eubacteriales bacterium OttesenSCG-928-K08]